MSNALAIATVTQALALQIANNLRPEIDLAVSVETRKPPAEPPTEPTITVFLYQVVPSASLRSHDLPTRAADGALLKRPAAALDLNFLISAYGEEAELVGQRLLGCVVRTLHEIPVLSRELLEEAAQRPYLAGTDLALSPQKVRFTQIQMDIDETSKLWGMLNQTPYVLSVCYQASLVLVEGLGKPAGRKPVEQVVAHAVPSVAPAAPGPPTGAQGDATGDGGPDSSPHRSAATPTGMRTPAATADAKERASGKTAAEGRSGRAGAAAAGRTGAAPTSESSGAPAGRTAPKPRRSRTSPSGPDSDKHESEGTEHPEDRPATAKASPAPARRRKTPTGTAAARNSKTQRDGRTTSSDQASDGEASEES